MSATMGQITRPDETTVSYETYGIGPPLVLVHGAFSDHLTNWREVRALIEEHFSVYALARRGRGRTSPTQGHAMEDEAEDIVAVLRQVGEPAFLLGHSYGALCALEAAARYPAGVRKLVLYEPPDPETVPAEVVTHLEQFGRRSDWDGMVHWFMSDVLQVPPDEVTAIRSSPDWSMWTADAPASINDLRAVCACRVDLKRYQALAMPVLLLVGSESPREFYLTDALAAVLPDARIVTLDGQAHEGMTTAPTQFVDAITPFLE